MRYSLFIIFLPLIFSCQSKKSYEDYSEDDFYEVQGIIESAYRTRDPFDGTNVKNITYRYFLDRPTPKHGIEEDLPIINVQEGYPLIVLVHKDDENISFFGTIGVLDSLNEKEKVIMREHIQSEINKLK